MMPDTLSKLRSDYQPPLALVSRISEKRHRRDVIGVMTR
jgi:hypothetical protein